MKEVSIVWLLMIVLSLGGLGVLTFTSRQWQGAHHDADLGWMSQQWLAQYRANSR